MKTIVIRDIRRFFTGKILFLLFGCFLFGFTERQATRLSYEQFVLNMVAEHYYLTYFMIPVFLLYIYISLEEGMDYVLVRGRYYWHYFLAKASAFLLNVIGFVGIQLVTIMLLGIGLRKDNSFWLSGDIHFGIEELFIAYAKHFNTPLLASIMASAYMIIGLTVLSIVFLLLHHFLEKKTVSIVMITLYFFMTLGLKIPGLNGIPFLFMDNYIILHHNFTSNGKIIMSLMSMLILLIGTGILVKCFWRKRPKWTMKLQKRGITFYYARYVFTEKNILIMLAVLSFISIWKLVNLSVFQDATAEDFFLSMFYGHGVDGFQMIGFIEMLILNGVPLYLFAIFVETINNEQNLGLTIRMKYKQNWTRAIFRIGVSFIAMYVTLMVVFGIVLAMMKGLPMDGFIGFVLEVSTLKFLDITFQLLLFLLLFIWKRNVTMAFLIVLGSNAIILFPVAWVIYLPTGLSSMARSSLILGEEGLPFKIGALILAICVLGQWLYIKFIAYKKVLGG